MYNFIGLFESKEQFDLFVSRTKPEIGNFAIVKINKMIEDKDGNSYLEEGYYSWQYVFDEWKETAKIDAKRFGVIENN